MYNLQIFLSAILPFIWSVSAAPGILLARNKGKTFSVSTYIPTASQSPSPNIDAPHVLPIRATKAGTATGAGYAKALRSNNQVSGTYGTSELSTEESGMSLHVRSNGGSRRVLAYTL